MPITSFSHRGPQLTARPGSKRWRAQIIKRRCFLAVYYRENPRAVSAELDILDRLECC